MKKSAEISACGKYRYHLRREWGTELAVSRVTFIMLNPSTADDKEDDATIRRCVAFAKSWGYGGVDVVNLFAYRATEPRELKRASNPIGPDNDSRIVATALCTNKIVCAWGIHGNLFGRGQRVTEKLLAAGKTLYCLEKTKKGLPKHPLYLKSDLIPVLM